MRRSLARIAVVSLVLLLGAAAAPERSEAGGIKDVIDGAICGYVESEAGATAGRKIIARVRGSSRASHGALIAIAIWSAQKFCSAAIPRVTAALSAAFGSQGSPSPAPTPADVDVLLRRLKASGVAADLRLVGIKVTRTGVQRSAGTMCRNLRRGTDAASIGRQLAGRYQVRALAALSGLVGLTKNCAHPPAPWQLDSLSAALATTLVANTYRRDVEPPIVALRSLYRNTASDGRTELTLEWSVFDSATSVSEPWLWLDGAWKRIALNLNRPDATRVWLRPGTSFQFAVRATDAHGNTSAFSYSAMFRA